MSIIPYYIILSIPRADIVLKYICSTRLRPPQADYAEVLQINQEGL